MDTEEAFLQSEAFFDSNYVGVSFELEHCVEYRDPSECKSEDEVFAYWKSPESTFWLQVDHKEVDMRNMTHPIRQSRKVFSMALEPNIGQNHSVFLSPNEFEDDTDWLGLIHGVPDA